MGGKSKSKAPPAPDYNALMQQQQAQYNQQYQKQLSDIQSQIASATQANRATQVTPQGTLSWSQGPNGQWTQTMNYSPETQALYDKFMANQNQALDVSGQANTQLQQLMAKGAWQGPAITAQYSQDYANKYADQMQQTLTARLQPQYTQDQNAMQTKLALQGLQPGTEAYDRAYQNLLKSQGDVISQANLQAQLAGQSEARNQFQTELAGQEAQRTASMQDYLLPWQTASQAAGLAGSLQTPQFGGYAQQAVGGTPQLQSTDIVAAAQQQYAQQMQNYNQQQQKSSGKGSSIGSIAGGIGGAFLGGPLGASAGSAIGGAAGGALFSDVRMKEHIQPLDDEALFHKLISIVPVEWDWIDSGEHDTGLLAQQIAQRIPELTVLAENGMLKVNYTGYVALLQGAFRHLAMGVRHGL